MVNSQTGKTLLRGNNNLRAGSLRCDDIEGAQAKKMNQRSVPRNPLDPAYQPLEPMVLPPRAQAKPDESTGRVHTGMDSSKKREWGSRAVLSRPLQKGMDSTGHLLHLTRETELAGLWESQGELRMQGRRTRKDYRATNDISDIELAGPRQTTARTHAPRLLHFCHHLGTRG